jgi:hypothetical protein
MTQASIQMPKLPSGVWVLGFVSLLMDVSSEMIHSLLPLFLVGTLGASAARPYCTSRNKASQPAR